MSFVDIESLLKTPDKKNAICINQEKPANSTSVKTLSKIFYKLALPFWKTESLARWKLAILVILALLRSMFNVFFSFIARYVPQGLLAVTSLVISFIKIFVSKLSSLSIWFYRDFWTALNERNGRTFYLLLAAFAVVMCIATPLSVFFEYYRDHLSIFWREWLTTRTLAAYFLKRNYYVIEKYSEEVFLDNPDQRIADDIASFTNESLTLGLQMIISTVDLICFLSILLSIYPPLFFILAGYSAFGTIVTTLVGKRLISLNLNRLRIEADFRFGLIRIRENAESIAFYRGERREQREVEGRFLAVVNNFIDIIRYQRSVRMFTTFYEHIIQVRAIHLASA